jgi:hypothetical protein
MQGEYSVWRLSETAQPLLPEKYILLSPVTQGMRMWRDIDNEMSKDNTEQIIRTPTFRFMCILSSLNLENKVLQDFIMFQIKGRIYMAYNINET